MCVCVQGGSESIITSSINSLSSSLGACKLGVLFELSSGAQTKIVQSCIVQMRHISKFSSFFSSAVLEEVRLYFTLFVAMYFIPASAGKEGKRGDPGGTARW